MNLAPGRILALSLVGSLAVALLANMVYEEPPTGAIEGRVTFAENGKPFVRARVTLVRDAGSMNADEELWVRTAKADEEGAFSFSGVEEGYYTLHVAGKAHEELTTTVHVLEGHVTDAKLVMRPVDPYLRSWANRSVTPPGEEPAILVSGFVPAEKLEWSLKRLDDDWWKKAESGALADWVTRQWYAPPETRPKELKLVATGSHTIQNRDIEGDFTDRISFGNLEEGLYFVQIATGALRSYSWLFVSSIGMITKSDGKKQLFYVSDVQTGEPVPGVEIFDLDARQSVGRTNASGTLNLPVSSTDERKWLAVRGRSAAPLFAWSPRSERFVRVFLYTDRPIYRPGETIRFKAVVRELVGNDYRVLANEAVTLEFTDADSTRLGEQTYTTSASGSFSGEFALSREVAPGGVLIEWTIGDTRDSIWVPVADYEKPMYEVKVTPESPGVLSGERARFTIEAKYYFGAPAVNKKVSVSVTRRELYPWERLASEADEDEWYFFEEEDYGDWVQDFEVTTDENGKATITVRPEVGEQDERWTVSAYLSDEGGGYGDGEASVDVLRAGISVVLDQQEYMLAAGQPTTLRAVVTDLSGKRVAGAEVVAEIQTVDWVRGKMAVQTYARQGFRMGEDGSVSIPIRAIGSESFRVVVSAKDSRGRATSESAYYYVFGSDFDMPGGELELIADKKTYRPGETCKLAIRAEKPGGAALLTVEGDELYSARVVRLDRPVTIVEIPVSTAYVPNVEVLVSRVWNANYVVARTSVIADPTTRKLTIDVEPERQSARPGETVPIRIRTTVDGRPVSAEVALTVVDEALYAVREDTADILRTFYPRRWNQVATYSSIEEAFLDSGPKDSPAPEIREQFEDVAAWVPNVQTGESGEARVNVTFPDNLTTWRCTAIGATSDTHVGKGIAQVRVAVPLSVSVSTPGVVVEEDRFLVEATVRNDTGRAATVSVSAAAEGAQLEGESRQFEIPNGSSRVVQWWATAGRGESATVTVSARSDAASDGMARRIQVLPKGVWQFDSISALTSETSWTGEVNLRSDRTDLGELTVRVSPSIAASLAASLDSLIDYPYGCAEQTMSRFLPAVLVAATLRDLRLPPPPRASQIPQITRDSLLRLDRMQHSEGGWGWWEGEEPDLYITSLVLEGLSLARLHGVAVPTPMVDRGVGWLRSQWEGRKVNLASGAASYAAYVLSLYDPQAAASALRTVTPRTGVDWAYVALGWSLVGDGRRSAESLARLKSLAKVQGDFASWEDANWWNSEPTAICSRALVELAPEDPLVTKSIRYLLFQRDREWWRTTRETSYALIALTSYLRRAPVSLAPMEVRIAVNGETVLQRRVSSDQLATEIVATIPNSKLKKGKNVVSVERSGGGAALIQAYVREVSAQPPKATQGLYILRDFYALETVRRPDGSLDQVTGTEPVRSWRLGDVVICKVTVDFDGNGNWVQVDVPIPSNLRVMEPYGESYRDGWTMVWSRNSVSLFKPYVAAGAEVIEIRLRASSLGKASALPASLYNMYNPTYRAYAPTLEVEVGR